MTSGPSLGSEQPVFQPDHEPRTLNIRDFGAMNAGRQIPSMRLRVARICKLVPPVNNGFTFQRRTGTVFSLFPGGFGARPHLLDAGEEQIATMLLVERHRIIVAQFGGFDLRSDQHAAIQARSRPAQPPPNRAGTNRSFVFAWLCPLFVHTLKNEFRAVSGQDALGVRLLPAFDLLDMRGERLGAAFIGFRIDRPDHHHLDR